MEFIGGRLGSRRGVLALVLAAMAAALTLAVAAPAQAENLPKAWGFNKDGELGNGTMSEQSTVPVAVKGLAGVTALSGSNRHGLALLEGGTVMSWGDNESGQLGDGKHGFGQGSTVPVAVCAPAPQPCPGSHLAEVTAITAGGEQSMALLKDGTVVDWGRNLGNGGTESSDVPVAVGGLSGVTAISAGFSFRLVLLKDGTVMAWGDNGYGQLGDGTTAGSAVPVAVSGLKEVVQVSAGRQHALALLNGHKVMAWGRNDSGQLGNGTLTKPGEPGSDVPVAVSPGSNGHGFEVTAIAAGENFNLALLKDHTVQSWGRNSSGQLGVGPKPGPEPCGEVPPFSCSKTPVAVEGLSGVAAIAVGSAHSLALLEAGTVMAWGDNALGQLGDGTSTGPEPCGPSACSTSPVAVCAEGLEAPCPSGPFLSHVEDVATGSSFSFALVELPPTVTAISPKEGPKKGSTTVSITGTSFSEAISVKFGSTPAKSFKVNSDTSITAVSPPGTGTVDVTVTNPASTSSTSLADKFVYSRPTVKKLSPRRGGELGGTSVTITGTNFAGATAVKFGSNDATSFKVNSETSITAVSPAHTSGKVDVTVATPNGASAISNKDRFRYT